MLALSLMRLAEHGEVVLIVHKKNSHSSRDTSISPFLFKISFSYFSYELVIECTLKHHVKYKILYNNDENVILYNDI